MVAEHPKFRRPKHAGRSTLSTRLTRAPETAKFLRRAAPAFLKEISKEYKRETLPVLHRRIAGCMRLGLDTAAF